MLGQGLDFDKFLILARSFSSWVTQGQSLNLYEISEYSLVKLD